MKRFMTIIFAVFPLGIFAQSTQNVYTKTDNILNTSYADASNTFSDEKEESLETPVLNVFEQDNSTDDMFIVTDMLLAGPESTGKTDILSIDLLEDGTYGKPENLGSKINTEEREVFPYVDDSSMLYFASDIESKGDELNVFAAKVMDNEVSTPIKLDVQANASKDDYATAYKAIEIEAMKIAEKEAELRDYKILLEGENLAEIERIEKTYSEFLRGDA